MKNAVPPQAIYGILGVVALIIVVAAYLKFKPEDAGPPVKPNKFNVPAGFKGLRPPGAPADAPVGAPGKP